MAQDPRGRRLSALDSHCRDFVDEARRTTEGGERLARREIEGLADLADHVVRSLGHWRDSAARFDLAQRAPLDVPLAARVMVETVFDDVLAPEATRVFAAAIDLAL